MRRQRASVCRVNRCCNGPNNRRRVSAGDRYDRIRLIKNLFLSNFIYLTKSCISVRSRN